MSEATTMQGSVAGTRRPMAPTKETEVDLGLYRVIQREGERVCLRERRPLPEGGEDPMAPTFWTTVSSTNELARMAQVQTRIAVLVSVGQDGIHYAAVESRDHADEEELPSVYLRVGESWSEAASRAAEKAGLYVGIDLRPLVDEMVPMSTHATRTERRIILGSQQAGSILTREILYADVEHLERGPFGAFVARADEALRSRRALR